MHKNIQKLVAVFLAVMITVLYTPVTAFASSSDEADDITYTIDSDEELSFKAKDFKNVYEDLYGDDEEIDYIEFGSMPSSSKGTLYDDDDDEIDDDDEFDYDELSDITFIPKKSYSGTVSISYTGYDTDDNEYTGKIKIKVEESEESGDIEYEVNSGDTVDFEEDDFNDYCQDENDEDLSFVIFELPSSSKGTLYYDYDGDDEEKVDDDEEYYYDDNDELSIDDITFVAKSTYSGDVVIDFEGEDEEGDDISGSVVIHVIDEDDLDDADDITYSAKAGATINFDDDDFNDVCDDLTDNDIDYVKFILPSSSKGTLYYGSSTKVSGSTKYYYDEKPYLRSVNFVPFGDNTGTVTLEYTGYDTDGDAFKGEIKITYAAQASTDSLYFSDVSGTYSWAIQYVDTLYSVGALTGTTGSNGKILYNPGTNITRGDFMLYLYKALNLTYNTSAGSFSDVPAGSKYYDAIASAKALGIAKGYNNIYGVNQPITREDAMVLALRTMSVSGMGYVQGDLNSLTAFNDNAQISDYARDAIATLVKTGIITGSNNQITPKSNISRAEAAAMIYRIKY